MEGQQQLGMGWIVKSDWSCPSELPPCANTGRAAVGQSTLPPHPAACAMAASGGCLRLQAAVPLDMLQ